MIAAYGKLACQILPEANASIGPLNVEASSFLQSYAVLNNKQTISIFPDLPHLSGPTFGAGSASLEIVSSPA